MALDPHAILILATRPLKDIDKFDVVKDVWNNRNTIVMELEGLSSNEMIEMAQQILNVQELPDQIVKIIRARSHGIPLWCEELVETMLELKVLTVVEEDEVIVEEEEEDEEGERGEGTERQGENKDKIYLSVSRMQNHKKKSVVLKTVKRRRSCLGQSRVSIDDIPIPDSVAGMVLTRIDNMNPSEQMSLKCAAVLGTTFHSDMLEAIIPNCNPTTFRQTLSTLAEHGIIECAIAAEIRTRYRNTAASAATHTEDPHFQCPCLKKIHHHHRFSFQGTSHPPVNECTQLQFVHTYIQETAYDLWTKTQSQALHESAAVFLESQAHKCSNCGGGGFFVMRHKQRKGSSKKKKSSSHKGRSFMGASAIRHKLRRSNDGRGRRSNRVFSVELDESVPPLVASRRLSQQLPTAAVNPQINSETICSVDLGIDMQNCHCDEVLYHVYPQLVQHWRAAGNVEKTLNYLIDSAGAALATFNNMEAISLLQEVKEILKHEKILSTMELAKLESLFGQV